MKLFASNYFMGLDISKVNTVYYGYICDREVFFHPDMVSDPNKIDFSIKNCDIFFMNLKFLLVTPGNKILHHFRHHNRFNTGGVHIDDIAGAYSSYFLSEKHDQVLILSPIYGAVNISWHNDDGRFITTIDNETGNSKTTAID